MASRNSCCSGCTGELVCRPHPSASPRIQPLMARRQEQKGDSTLQGKSGRSGKESRPRESQSVAEVTVHKAAQGYALSMASAGRNKTHWKRCRLEIPKRSGGWGLPWLTSHMLWSEQQIFMPLTEDGISSGSKSPMIFSLSCSVSGPLTRELLNSSP